MARVLVALSGGVDSAVAAALLVDQGHDVTAVHLRLAETPLEDQVAGQGCCTLDDAQDARRAAQVLGLPFYVWDLTAAFRERVQEPFAAAYAAGHTPNPCVTCNERVKYAALLARARSLGFDALATGHHVRLRRDGAAVTTPGPGVVMHRAADPRKDQSYVLHMATPDQLAHSLFPVGEHTKDEVRRLAADRGLRVADKPESFDVCFIPDGDTAGYLARHLPERPGEVVDVDGTVLGRHRGTWRYTIGQRRGLGLGAHERRFVVDVDAGAARVVVGPREALATRWLEVGAVSWVSGTPPAGPVRVQIRAHARSVAAHLSPCAEGWRVTCEEPLHGVATGQAAVLYDPADEVCLGGGRIRAADRAAGLATRDERTSLG